MGSQEGGVLSAAPLTTPAPLTKLTTPTPARRAVPAAAAVALLLAAGCAQPPKTLYLWETFPRQQYDTLLANGQAPQAQIGVLQAHVEKARAGGVALPPGLRAHLGMLQLAAGNPAEARQLWLAEKTAFPESTIYMDQLLRRLDGAPAPSLAASAAPVNAAPPAAAR